MNITDDSSDNHKKCAPLCKNGKVQNKCLPIKFTELNKKLN